MLFLQRFLSASEVMITEAYPECIVTLDRFNGERRNTDILVLGTAGPYKLAISIEAKADEPFGDQLVGVYYDCRRTVPGSNLPARIAGLSRALFNVDLDPRIRSLAINSCMPRRERSSRPDNTAPTSPFSLFTSLFRIGSATPNSRATRATGKPFSPRLSKMPRSRYTPIASSGLCESPAGAAFLRTCHYI